MNKHTLEKITNGEYYVDDKHNTYRKDGQRICNFRIKQLSFVSHLEKNVAFNITLKSAVTTDSATIPLCFYNEPSKFLLYGFDVYDFQICCAASDFDKAMLDILNAMIDSGKVDNEERIIGWDITRFNWSKFSIGETFLFGVVDNPDESISLKKRLKPRDYVDEYSQLVGEKISIPLLSFMLLSLLNSFDLLGKDIYPSFFASITGGDKAETRKKVALFYTNLYKRRADLQTKLTDLFHFQDSDKSADIFFKAAFQKDCVLIAGEPTKRRCNLLASKIYAGASENGVIAVDEQRPVRSSCLITAPCVDNIPFETFNICLPEDIDFDRKLKAYFCEKHIEISPKLEAKLHPFEEPLYLEKDHLTESVYYFIHRLIVKLSEDKDYLRIAFRQFKTYFNRTCANDSYTEKAEETAMLLCFAYALYQDIYYEGEEEKNVVLLQDLKKRTAFEIICRTAKNSFPRKKAVTDTSVQNTLELCSFLDMYFDEKTGKSKAIYVKKTGGEETDLPIKVWYDDECFYIHGKELAEMLKLTGCRHKLSEIVKKVLAQRKIIKTVEKEEKNGVRVEYALHLQKQLHGKITTKRRFITFQREKCKEQNLFTNLEKIFREQDEKARDGKTK